MEPRVSGFNAKNRTKKMGFKASVRIDYEG